MDERHFGRFPFRYLDAIHSYDDFLPHSFIPHPLHNQNFPSFTRQTVCRVNCNGRLGGWLVCGRAAVGWNFKLGNRISSHLYRGLRSNKRLDTRSLVHYLWFIVRTSEYCDYTVAPRYYVYVFHYYHHRRATIVTASSGHGVAVKTSHQIQVKFQST